MDWMDGIYGQGGGESDGIYWLNFTSELAEYAGDVRLLTATVN